MKKIITIALGIMISGFSYSSSIETKIKSKIKGVTVYLSGAQVSRKGFVKLNKGINKLRFENVSPHIQANTIQVKGKGNYIILDVKKSIEYPVQETVDNTIPKEILIKIKATEDSVFNINYKIEDLNNKLTFLVTEKNYLLKNNVFTNDSLPIVEQSLVFLRKRLFDINAKNMTFKKERDVALLSKKDIEARLQEIKNFRNKNKPVVTNKPIHYVEVTVQAKQDNQGSMTIKYLVNNAGWSPLYDIRVENVNKPVEIIMKANVYQNSGENWNDVKLKLSTNDPFKSKVKPELSVWYLNYYNPNLGYHQRLKNQNVSKMSLKAKTKADRFKDMEEEGELLDNMPTAISSIKYSVRKELMTNVEYKISLPYSVKTDNKAHMVAVNKQVIKSNYYHYLVPKYDNESYLVAKLVDWEGLNLLPSKANVFFGGSYVGETRINPTTSDTLNISLGNDRNVRIKRTKNKEKTKDKVFSNQKEKTVSYDLIIKNVNLKDINVIVEDHLPISNDESIKTKVENKSGATFNKRKGFLSWNFILKSKEIKKINYTYSIKYDKTKNLNISSL